MVTASCVAKIGESDVITRTGDFFISRRGPLCCVLEPESARFLVMEPEYWRVFAHLERPRTFGDLVRTFPDLGAQFLEPFVQQLHYTGLVRLRGKAFRNAAFLWRQVLAAPSFVALHLGSACNFRCTYCYSPAASGAPMTKETAGNIIRRYLAALPGDALSIDFLGGEPLLNFDVMVYAMQTAMEVLRDKRVSFLVQTNGSLLDSEKIKILKKFNVGVGVSLDGPAQIHDQNRLDAEGRGTHSIVLENMSRARDAGLQVAPLAVITEPSQYVPVLEFFVSRGFDFVRMNYSSCLGRARGSMSFPHARGEEFAREYIRMARRANQLSRLEGRKIQISDLKYHLANLTRAQRDYMCLKSPCGAGENIISFDGEGRAYACEEYDSQTKARMCLGVPEDGDIVKFLRESPVMIALRGRTVESIPRCRRCPFRNLCCGGCAHKALAAFGDFLREDPMCRFYQVVFEDLMWLITENPSVVRNLRG
jgi:radical SAM protein with 4Fe4S-binding SPASM domain